MGIRYLPRSLTPQGTNVVGHFVFFKQVVPLLQASAKFAVPNATRVVLTSSNGHVFGPAAIIDFNDVNLTNSGAWTRYGQSKSVHYSSIHFLDLW